MIFNIHLTEEHVYIAISFFYIWFGLTPVVVNRSKGMITCLKKLRILYIVVGLCYLTLVFLHAHDEAEKPPLNKATITSKV